jgi:hypothetical protein
MPTIRPAADESAPYYHRYISRVPDGNVIDVLRAQSDSFAAFLSRVPRGRETYAYAPGKWTINEIAQHVADTERVMTYRALRIGRGDVIPLPGFDEDAWAPLSGANERTLTDITAEFTAVRRATVALFAGFPPHAWARRGTASDQPVSVRALAYIIGGHVAHHESIVQDRYLNA